MPYELFIALKYLRAKRKQVMISVITVIAVAAVTAGVASLILVLAMMTGFREDFQTKILSGTSDINLLRKDGKPLEDYRSVEERVARFPHVRTAGATLYQQVLLQGKQDTGFAMLKGVDLSAPAQANEVFKFVLGGDPRDLAHPEIDPESGALIDKMIIGKDLAQATGLAVGDIATVISPRGHLTPMGLAPRYRDFRVIGMFESGLAEYDSTWAYISLDAAGRLTGQENVAQMIQIKVDDIYDVKRIGRNLLDTFGGDYGVQDWQELNAPVYSALSYEKLLSGIALLIVITIAALNIITVLIIMVMEKQRDIAILMSMGATRRSVLSIFMIQGMIIGIIGIALGVALGCGLSYVADSRHLINLPAGVYSLSYVPFRAHAIDVLTVAVVTLIISFLSTIYPSLSAARLQPVEALRYE